MSQKKPTGFLMEVDQTATTSKIEVKEAVKSKRVNADDLNKDSNESKKPRLDSNESRKVKILKFMIEGNWSIAKKATLSKEFMSSMTVAMQVHNIFFTCHNINRQSFLRLRKGKKMTTDFVISYKGKEYSVTRTETVAEMAKISETYGLPYKWLGKDDEANWYSTAEAIFNYSVGFQLRMKELRVGHSKMPMTKEGNTNISYVNVKDMGIYERHYVLCEGMSWPPKRKSSMPQCMDSLVALVQLMNTPRECSLKWRTAVLRDMPHIPQIEAIVNKLIGKSYSSVKPLITALADVLLIVWGRHKTRMFFPTNMLLRGLWPGCVKDDTFQREVEVSDIMPVFDYRGAGGFLLYKKMHGQIFSVPGSFSEEKVSQVIFHSIFGTYKADFGVLTGMTNVVKWYTRTELGNGFMETGTTQEVEGKIPEIRYWSRMGGGDMTGMLTTSDSQPTIVRSSETRGFIECMSRQRRERTDTRTIAGLVEMLVYLKEDLLDELIKKNGKQEFGNSSWYDMTNLTTDGIGEPSNLILESSGDMFLTNYYYI